MSRLKVGHIGCGTVYLLSDEQHELVNVDVEGHSALASDCPQGVYKWGTEYVPDTEYYKNLPHIDELYLGNGTPDHEATVVDCYGTFTNLPFQDGELDILLARQVYEHLSKRDSYYAMREIRRVLKMRGILRLSVPDFDASLSLYADLKHQAKMESNFEEAAKLEARAAFMLRHILGSRKNDWAYHSGSWTEQKLISFVRQFGFHLCSFETNIHFYPAICARFEKQPLSECPWADQTLDDAIIPWKAAYEYCGNPLGTPLSVPDGWKVLEVGPGSNRWPRAQAYVDIDPFKISKIQDEFRAMPGVEWPEFAEANVESLPPNWTGKFDYALTSHVLEHCQDPLKAAAELNRVAKSGCVVCPSPFKEGMFLAHEQDHKWWVIPSRDRLYFHRLPPGHYSTVYDSELSGEMHRIWRYGERRIETICDRAKKFFHEKECLLDSILHWGPETGGLKIEVVE